MNGYDFFRIYRAVQYHFSGTGYDAITHQMKGANLTVEAYDKLGKGDILRFDYYAPKMQGKEMCFDFCVANTLFNENPKWLYKSFSDSRPVYNAWLKHMLRLKENIKNEFTILQESKGEKSFEDMLIQTSSGKNPPLYQLWAVRKKISYEAMVVLDNRFDFVDGWGELFKSDPLGSRNVLWLSRYKILFNRKYKKEYIAS